MSISATWVKYSGLVADCDNTENVLSVTNHGLIDNDEIVLSSKSNPSNPNELKSNKKYYVKKIDSNNFQLCEHPNGFGIDFSSGTQLNCYKIISSGFDDIYINMELDETITNLYGIKFVGNGAKDIILYIPSAHINVYQNNAVNPDSDITFGSLYSTTLRIEGKIVTSPSDSSDYMDFLQDALKFNDFLMSTPGEIHYTDPFNIKITGLNNLNDVDIRGLNFEIKFDLNF